MVVDQGNLQESVDVLNRVHGIELAESGEAAGDDDAEGARDVLVGD